MRNSLSDAADTPDADRKLFRKAAWRLMPFLFVCYLFAQVDRMNIAFAKLDMLDDLGFGSRLRPGRGRVLHRLRAVRSAQQHAAAALRRAPLAGAHHGVLGLVSAGMMFVQTPMQFYIMRFLLGMAEAGFFPASSSTSLAGSRASTAAG